MWEIYDYFASLCGIVDCSDVNRFKRIYGNQSVNDLKKKLKQLKSSTSSLDEIRYVSKLIRRKLSKDSSVDDCDDITTE